MFLLGPAAPALPGTGAAVAGPRGPGRAWGTGAGGDAAQRLRPFCRGAKKELEKRKHRNNQLNNRNDIELPRKENAGQAGRPVPGPCGLAVASGHSAPGTPKPWPRLLNHSMTPSRAASSQSQNFRCQTQRLHPELCPSHRARIGLPLCFAGHPS